MSSGGVEIDRPFMVKRDSEERVECAQDLLDRSTGSRGKLDLVGFVVSRVVVSSIFDAGIGTTVLG